MRFFKRHKFLTVILLLVSYYIYSNYTMIIDVNPKIDRNNKLYVNDIYMSDGRIYNLLTNDEKIAYDYIIKTVKERKSKVNIDINKFEDKDLNTIGGNFFNATDAILIDHPELLQFATVGYSYNEGKTNFKLKVFYAINNPIMEEINTLKIQRMINKIKIKTKNMSDLEKIRYVYEWVGDTAKYDTIFTFASKNQSIYNVFIKKNAVCAGFAKTSQVIFQNIGIESMGVIGETSGKHMWNIVKYNGKYYFFDSTYAASIRDKKINIIIMD